MMPVHTSLVEMEGIDTLMSGSLISSLASVSGSDILPFLALQKHPTKRQSTEFYLFNKSWSCIDHHTDSQALVESD